MSTEQYQNELNNLRELAVEFAEKHPALAPQLSGPSPDPDVERILEGVAFLTGNIREKLDDDFPEFAQSLMQMIFPHYLRPLPSATIVEFKPKSILKGNVKVPAETFVDSKEIEATSCRFKTCYPVNVAPASVSNISVKEMGLHKKQIEIDLSLTGTTLAEWGNNKFPFYIGGDYVGAVDLYMHLSSDLVKVEVTAGGNEVLELEASALQSKGFDTKAALIPYPSTGFPAYRMIQEYFLFKEKFLFLEVTGLEKFGSASNLKFTFKFEGIDGKLPRITPERFTLHSTPAINLFEHDAEPIKMDNRSSELRIKPGKGRARGSSEHFQIYSIDSIT